jgi:hypothetical protein
MSIFTDIINVVTNPVGAAVGLITKVAKDIGSDKVEDVVGALTGKTLPPELQVRVEESVREYELKAQESRQNFVIQHSGAAKDMPRFIQIVRGLVRPLITLWAFGLLNWAMWMILNSTEMSMMDAFLFVFKVIAGINVITLGFWFGTKALERSGLVQIFKGWRKGKAE